MSKSNNTTNSEISLFDSFKKCQANQVQIGSASDCNILNSIHLSENDHTNILWQILQHKHNGKFIFLESFVKEVLGLDLNLDDSSPLAEGSGTQYNAIPLSKDKSSGYIDLLLNCSTNDKNKIIIIENKVCGAGDMKWQLLRYYYSFVETSTFDLVLGNSKEIFKTNYDYYHQQQKPLYLSEDVYVVYLTKDGTKEPSKESIGRLNYIPVSYFGEDRNDRKNILRWLEEDVLPNMPYIESGRLLQGLILYIDYLKNELDVNSDIPVDAKLFDDLQIGEMPIKDLVNEYRKCIDNNNSSKNTTKIVEEDKQKSKFLIFLKACINRKLSTLLSEVNKDWSIYWTPSYIMLFKTEWLNLYPCSSNRCLMHWELLRDFRKEGGFSKWEFHLEGPVLKDCIDEVANALKVENPKSSHRLKNAFDRKENGYDRKENGYILNDNDDNNIKNFFNQLFGELDEKTKKIVEIVNKKLNINQSQPNNEVKQ